jgi:hypothetical protein
MFPGCRNQRLFFHLAQNIHKHLAGIGSSHLHNNDAAFTLNIKMAIALAFVPIAQSMSMSHI